MFVLPTAKILLFIALHVGPSHAPVIYATSNSESYVWSNTDNGWTVEAKGFPASDFTRDPKQTMTFGKYPPVDSIPPYLRAIADYPWRNHSAMVFDNGDRVEKTGDHAFFIINAGGANEKVFTIFFPPQSK
jgi:hypothetical protein